ncbi:MAG: tRNA (cytidine/uridine-2'-O-)-methyltransferase [Flavobacteriaceae bacterium]
MKQISKEELLKKLNSLGYNIVLIEPEIPNNTGNIGRLSLATGSSLHLVKPFGFEINDSRLKRAGLDYWQHLSVFTYENIEEFYAKNKEADMVYFSSHGKKEYTQNKFKDNQFLIFGKESVGLPKEIITKNPETTHHIPILSTHVRSLNLANAVSIVVYEGLRALKV